MAVETKPQLKDLIRELSDLSWSEVKDAAIQLGIKFNKLQWIERKYSDESERLSAAMQLWLETDTEACWKKIAEALRVNEKNALAEGIETKFCRPTLNPRPHQQLGTAFMQPQLHKVPVRALPCTPPEYTAFQKS